MKIIAFISNLSKGGAQGVFVTIVNHIQENTNDDVEVVVQNLVDPVNREFLNRNIKIHDLGVNSAKRLFVPLKQYIDKNIFDIAFVFSPEMSVGLVLVRQFSRADFKIYSRCMNTLSVEYREAESFFRRYISHGMIKIFYHKVDKVVAQSQGMKKDLIDNYYFQETKVNVINNALSAKYEQLLDNNTEGEKEKLLLFVGRLEKQKGLQMLLQAFSKIKHAGYRLILVGDGSQKEMLIALSEQLNISQSVEFIRYTNDVAEYYKKAVLTLLTSYYEGFPNVLIESMACGTPVVSYDLPSGPSEIINNDNGLLVPYLDVEKLVELIDKGIDKQWNCSLIKESVKKYKRENIMKQYIDWIMG